MEPDSLDIERPESLLAYLRRRGLIGCEERPEFTVLRGGVSNRTVLVQRNNGQSWVLKQALAKLRVQVDWFSDPSRIRREALALRHLPHLAPANTVTPLVFEDAQQHILAMQAVPHPHDNWKTLLLAGNVEPDHVEQFATILAAIHRASHQQRDTLAPLFADRSFFESLRLEPYYQYTAQQVPPAASFLHDLIAQTRTQSLALVHGDYSPKNILVHNGRLVLLDHEVIHWGDPAFDLGFSLTHFLSKAHHLPPFRAGLAEAARRYYSSYSNYLGDVPWRGGFESRVVAHTLACLLARVCGRSPLEYLDPLERDRQRSAVLALLRAPPTDLPAFVDQFLDHLTP